jgi:hypothetical protein
MADEIENSDDTETVSGLRTDDDGVQTHDLELRPVRQNVPCSETCCERTARLEVNGAPLCDVCLQTKLGPTRIFIGMSAPIPDSGKPC